MQRVPSVPRSDTDTPEWSEDSRGETPASPTEHDVARARLEGPRSFDALYSRIGPALLAWADLRIPPAMRSRLEPEDLLQETWWRAMDGFERFDPAKGTFRTWIFGIATRTLLNHFRALRVRGELEDPERHRPARESLPSSLVQQATSISQTIARSEEARRLLAHAEALEGDDRTLFALCALEGRTAPEAAELLGLTASTAAKRWQRLRERLRRAIAAGELLADPLAAASTPLE